MTESAVAPVRQVSTVPQALHRPGGGERLAGVEVGMVGPAHSLGEVIISSAEVGRPREQSEITSVEGFDLVRPGQRGKGVAPPSPLVAVAALFPDFRWSGRRVLPPWSGHS